MKEEFNELTDSEKLEVENQFMRMKLMLERNASFGGGECRELPVELEHEFLKHVIEFERQYEHCKQVKVYDKIGRPQHFRAVNEIPEGEMEAAWLDLKSYLFTHGVDVDACSPNVSQRELYRFVIEELFEKEVDDLDFPGMIISFIYDEFYPDFVYENSRKITDDLFPELFGITPLFHEYIFVKNDIMFNGTLFPDYQQFKDHIDRFKSLFTVMELEHCEVDSCVINETISTVTGNYKAWAMAGTEKMSFEGKFNVELAVSDIGYWDIKVVEIEGLSL